MYSVRSTRLHSTVVLWSADPLVHSKEKKGNRPVTCIGHTNENEIGQLEFPCMVVKQLIESISCHLKIIASVHSLYCVEEQPQSSLEVGLEWWLPYNTVQYHTYHTYHTIPYDTPSHLPLFPFRPVDSSWKEGKIYPTFFFCCIFFFSSLLFSPTFLLSSLPSSLTISSSISSPLIHDIHLT